MLSYAIMSLGSFGLLVLISNGKHEVSHIDDLYGLNERSPWLAFMMLFIMFSMAGIPPMVGFMAKVGVLEALIQVHLTWLAIVAIIFSVIGAYYYIRVVKVMYFESPRDETPHELSFDGRVVVSLNGLVVLLLGIFPGAFYALCRLVF